MSVVIPMRDAAATIADQLAALSGQDYSGPWELVVVDNGSTDGSADLVRSWSDRISPLKVVHESRPGIGPARNAGLSAAGGDLLLFCDADDVVQPGWISSLVTAAATADQVGGACDASLLTSDQAVMWRGQLSLLELPIKLEHLPFAPGGNCAIWRDVAVRLQGWDETFVAGSDDVDFSWRLQQSGGVLAFAEDARIGYRFKDDLRSLARQSYAYGLTEPLLLRRHADQGVPRPRPRYLWRVWRDLGKRIPRDVRDPVRRGQLVRDLSFHWGRLVGSVRHRSFLP